MNSIVAVIITLLAVGTCQAESASWTPGTSNGLRETAPAPIEPAPYPQANANPSPIQDAQLQTVAGDRYAPAAASSQAAQSQAAQSQAAQPGQFQPLRKLPLSALPSSSAATAKATPQKSIKQASEFQMRLTALELAVSTVVAERPNLWRFEPLEAEATQLLLLSSTEQDRQAVRQLAERLEHFSDIAHRYRDNRTVLSKVDQPRTIEKSRPLSPSAQATSQSTVASSEVTPSQYDATGVLRPVVSKRPNAPKYALVDDRGRLTTFVTPTTGVDLEPLVGKRLGVRGNRGFIPEYQREHVTAERVATLDRVIR